MKLSVVTTLFKSSPYVSDFYERVTKVATEFSGNDYEIIFVNDGSPDDSLARVLDIRVNDPKVKIIDLSRNFGHHKAMMAGLSHAAGEFVFLIDSDLEESPEWLADFANLLLDSSGEEIDVVYGVQAERKGTFAERVGGRIYHWLLKTMIEIDLPLHIVTARLMRRRYVRALLLHEERDFFIGGLWANTGFNQKSITVEKSDTSPTTYSMSAKILLSLTAIISFSSLPLRFLCIAGLSIFLVAGLGALNMVFGRLFLSRPEDGWTSLIVSIWMLGGMSIFSIGLVGLYIDKLFIEVKRRPNFIVRATYGIDD